MDIDKLEGMFPPMIVPFNADESLDEVSFRREAAFLLQTGVDGISSGGDNSEGNRTSNYYLQRSPVQYYCTWRVFSNSED